MLSGWHTRAYNQCELGHNKVFILRRLADPDVWDLDLATKIDMWRLTSTYSN